jgi:hypothetical protein
LVLKSEHNSFLKLLESLPQNIGNTKRSLDNLEILVSNSKSASPILIDTSQRLTQEARTAILNGKEALSQGDLLNTEIRLSGLRLESVVNAIRDKVSEQVIATEPNTSSILTIITNLGASAGKLTGIPKTFTVKTPSGESQKIIGKENENLRLKLLRLENDLATLDTALLKTSRLLNSIKSARKESGNLKECKLKKIETAFSIKPNDLTVNLKPGTVHRIVVLNGKPPYKAKFVGTAPSSSVLLSRELDNAGHFEVVLKVDGNAKDDQFTVLINGSTNISSKLVNFKL